MNATKVLFMGTPDFAVPILESLVAREYQIVGVLTQPDKPVGRKRTLTPPPVKVAAQRLGLPVLQPKKVKDESVLDEIAKLDADIAVTAAYGQLLPQRLLDLPRTGCLNVHASLLPRWRGAAPIHRAIMAGDERTGVTIMKMVLALDAGPMLGQSEVEILSADNVGTLHDKLAHTGADLLLELLPDYLAGVLPLMEQSEDKVTYASRILPEDETVSWQQPRSVVHNHVRGLSPWPGARTMLNGKVFKIWETALTDTAADGTTAQSTGGVAQRDPGTVYEHGGQVLVQCGDGPLQLQQVQPAGKRLMSARDWYRGLQTAPLVFGENE